jgi:hypothetical protein
MVLSSFFFASEEAKRKEPNAIRKQQIRQEQKQNTTKPKETKHNQ